MNNLLQGIMAGVEMARQREQDDLAREQMQLQGQLDRQRLSAYNRQLELQNTNIQMQQEQNRRTAEEAARTTRNTGLENTHRTLVSAGFDPINAPTVDDLFANPQMGMTFLQAAADNHVFEDIAGVRVFDMERAENGEVIITGEDLEGNPVSESIPVAEANGFIRQVYGNAQSRGIGRGAERALGELSYVQPQESQTQPQAQQPAAAQPSATPGQPGSGVLMPQAEQPAPVSATDRILENSRRPNPLGQMVGRGIGGIPVGLGRLRDRFGREETPQSTRYSGPVTDFNMESDGPTSPAMQGARNRRNRLDAGLGITQTPEPGSGVLTREAQGEVAAEPARPDFNVSGPFSQENRSERQTNSERTRLPRTRPSVARDNPDAAVEAMDREPTQEDVATAQDIVQQTHTGDRARQHTRIRAATTLYATGNMSKEEYRNFVLYGHATQSGVNIANAQAEELRKQQTDMMDRYVKQEELRAKILANEQAGIQNDSDRIALRTSEQNFAVEVASAVNSANPAYMEMTPEERAIKDRQTAGVLIGTQETLRQLGLEVDLMHPTSFTDAQRLVRMMDRFNEEDDLGFGAKIMRPNIELDDFAALYMMRELGLENGSTGFWRNATRWLPFTNNDKPQMRDLLETSVAAFRQYSIRPEITVGLFAKMRENDPQLTIEEFEAIVGNEAAFNEQIERYINSAGNSQ